MIILYYVAAIGGLYVALNMNLLCTSYFLNSLAPNSGRDVSNSGQWPEYGTQWPE